MKLTECCCGDSYQKVDDYIICTNTDCENFLRTTRLNLPKKVAVYPLLAYSILLTLLLCFPYNHGKTHYKRIYRPILQKVVHEVIPELTMENVRSEVERLNLICPQHVLSQIKLESAYLTSDLLKRTNNMLGMRFPYRRKTTAIGMFIPTRDTIIYGNQKQLLTFKDELSYAVYPNWVYSLKDYKYWQEQNFNVAKRYLEFLKNNYAEDTLYIKKLIRLSSLAKSD